MLDFITEEHKMVSASTAALLADLGSVDRDRVLTCHERIAPAQIRQGLDGLGLFEALGPEALAASSLVQTLIAVESGKATLPYPMLENLSAAFLTAHAGHTGLNPATSLFSRPGLQADETELPILRDGVLSGTAPAVAFPALCDTLLVTVHSSSGNNPSTLALAAVGLARCTLRARGSVEPDYPVCDVVFPDLAIAEDAIIHELPDGRDPAGLLAMNETLLAAAEIAGASLRLVDMTTEYLLTRTQFGKPLGANQVLKHKLAEHHVRSQALVMMLQYAGAALDAAAPDADAAVRAAKYFAGTSGKELAQDMLQFHGAIGYTTEYPLHLPMRRILRLTASHGSTYTQGDLLYQGYSRERESASPKHNRN